MFECLLRIHAKTAERAWVKFGMKVLYLGLINMLLFISKNADETSWAT